MSQILHIFRKDCRRFWPEILLSLAITAVFIWVYPNQWHSEDLSASTQVSFLDLRHLQILAQAATALLPVSWLFLIARVVHAENLVGSRQFWLTRPYIWQKLLAEKSLFLIAFICIPFEAAQICLLARAGFQPLHYPGALLFNLASIMIAVVLPFFALAAVTSSILRIIGTFLVFTGIVIAIAFFVSSGPDNPSISTPYSDRFSIPAIIVFCGAALLIQYSSRKLWLARALLIVLVLSIAGFAASPFEPTLMPHYYPLLTQGKKSPLSLNFSTVVDVNITQTAKGQYTLALPVVITGNADNATFTPNDIRISIDALNGQQMTSGWQAIYNQYLLPDTEQTTLEVKVDKALFQQIQAGPVTLHIDLALTELKAGHTSQFTYNTDADMKIPQLGICSYSPGSRFRFSELFCKVPFHQPYLAKVALLESPDCNPDSIKSNSRLASTWTGSISHDPSDIGLTPVWSDPISLPNDAFRASPDAPAQTRTLCPGSPITVARYELVRRFQTRVDVRGLQFSKLKPILE